MCGGGLYIHLECNFCYVQQENGPINRAIYLITIVYHSFRMVDCYLFCIILLVVGGGILLLAEDARRVPSLSAGSIIL